jgi:hypothetical protein
VGASPRTDLAWSSGSHTSANGGALPASVREDVLLLVTELVTNAGRQAGVGPEQSLRIELQWRPQRMRVEVVDSGPGFARVPARFRRDESGGWEPVSRRSDRRWLGAHGVRHARVARDPVRRVSADPLRPGGPLRANGVR